MIIGNKDVNAQWVVSMNQTDFVDAALIKWAEHPDMQGKTVKQKKDYLKAIYKLCKGSNDDADVVPEVNAEGEQ